MRRRVSVLGSVALYALSLPTGRSYGFSSDTREVVRLDLTECRARALANAPEIVSARADVDAARLGVNIADRALLPTLTGEGGYLRSSVNRRGVPDFAANNGENEYVARGVVSAPLFMGGSLVAGQRKARAERAAAEHGGEMARATVILDTDSAYFGLLAAEEQQSIAAAAKAIAGELLRRVRVRHDNGEVPAFDVGKFELEVAQAKAAADTAAGNVVITKTELGTLVSLSADALEVIPVTVSDEGPALEPLETVVASGLEARPDLRRLENEAQALEDDVSIARAARLPQVRAGAAAGYDSLTLPDVRNDGWQAGVNLTVPIWNWGTLAAREQIARLAVEKAQQRIVGARRAVTSEITRRYLEVKLARQQLDTAEAAGQLARRNTEIARRGYELGLVSTLDLITSEHQATQLASQRAAAAADYHLARSRLDFAAGRLP